MQGVRIDYALLSPGLLEHVVSCEIISTLPPKWSDHAALLLELADIPAVPKHAPCALSSKRIKRYQQPKTSVAALFAKRRAIQSTMSAGPDAADDCKKPRMEEHTTAEASGRMQSTHEASTSKVLGDKALIASGIDGAGREAGTASTAGSNVIKESIMESEPSAERTKVDAEALGSNGILVDPGDRGPSQRGVSRKAGDSRSIERKDKETGSAKPYGSQKSIRAFFGKETAS